MSDWYSVRAQSPGVADVAIEGIISTGDIPRFCAALPRDARMIRLRVTSPGGDPTAALTIARALRAHPARVEVTIQKLAASAATLCVMAGDRVVIGSDAVAMVHNPHLVPGDATPRDARALRSAAAELDRMKDTMLDAYGWRLKGGREAIARLMDDTTWLDPAEAVRLGLADEVGAVAPSTVTAHVDAVALAQLGPIPPRFRDRIARLRDPYAWRSAVLATDPARLNLTEIYRRLNTPHQGGRP